MLMNKYNYRAQGSEDLYQDDDQPLQLHAPLPQPPMSITPINVMNVTEERAGQYMRPFHTASCQEHLLGALQHLPRSPAFHQEESVVREEVALRLIQEVIVMGVEEQDALDTCLVACGPLESLAACATTLQEIAAQNQGKKKKKKKKNRSPVSLESPSILETALRTIRRYLVKPASRMDNATSVKDAEALCWVESVATSLASTALQLNNGSNPKTAEESALESAKLSPLVAACLESLVKLVLLIPSHISNACLSLRLELPSWAMPNKFQPRLVEGALAMAMAVQLKQLRAIPVTYNYNANIDNLQLTPKVSLTSCSSIYFQSLVQLLVRHRNPDDVALGLYKYHERQHRNYQQALQRHQLQQQHPQSQPQYNLQQTQQQVSLHHQQQKQLCQLLLHLHRQRLSPRESSSLLRSIIISSIPRQAHASKIQQLTELWRTQLYPYMELSCRPILRVSYKVRDAFVRLLVMSPTSVLTEDWPDRLLCHCVASLLAGGNDQDLEYVQDDDDDDGSSSSDDSSDSSYDSDSDSNDDGLRPRQRRRRRKRPQDHHKILAKHVQDVIGTWSMSVFVRQTDYRLQRHVTNFLLSSLSFLNLKDDQNNAAGVSQGPNTPQPLQQASQLVSSLLEGVTVRLESSIPTIRKDGMMVAERLAQKMGQELEFDELEDERSSNGEFHAEDLNDDERTFLESVMTGVEFPMSFARGLTPEEPFVAKSHGRQDGKTKSRGGNHGDSRILDAMLSSHLHHQHQRSPPINKNKYVATQFAQDGQPQIVQPIIIMNEGQNGKVHHTQRNSRQQKRRESGCIRKDQRRRRHRGDRNAGSGDNGQPSSPRQKRRSYHQHENAGRSDDEDHDSDEYSDSEESEESEGAVAADQRYHHKYYYNSDQRQAQRHSSSEGDTDDERPGLGTNDEQCVTWDKDYVIPEPNQQSQQVNIQKVLDAKRGQINKKKSARAKQQLRKLVHDGSVKIVESPTLDTNGAGTEVEVILENSQHAATGEQAKGKDVPSLVFAMVEDDASEDGNRHRRDGTRGRRKKGALTEPPKSPKRVPLMDPAEIDAKILAKAYNRDGPDTEPRKKRDGRKRHQIDPAVVDAKIHQAMLGPTAVKHSERRKKEPLVDPDAPYTSGEDDDDSYDDYDYSRTSDVDDDYDSDGASNSEERASDDDSVWDASGVHLNAYNVDDDEEDLQETQRPRYLRECLELLRTPESDDRACSKQEAAMKWLPKIIKDAEPPADLPDLAAPLALELIRTENKFNIESFVQYKLSSVLALTVAEPLAVGQRLISMIWEDVSFMDRLDVLTILSEAAFELSGSKQLEEWQKEIAASSSTRRNGSFEANPGLLSCKQSSTLTDTGTVDSIVSLHAERARGRVESRTRRWGRGRRQQETLAIRSRFGPIAHVWYYSLVGGFMQRKDNSRLWGGPIGARLLANLFVTLATIVECSGNTPGTEVLAKDLFELVWSFRTVDVAEVRMGVLVAVAASLAFLPEELVLTMMFDGSLSSLPEGLKQMSQSDPDNSCRRLAQSMHQGVAGLVESLQPVGKLSATPQSHGKAFI